MHLHENGGVWDPRLNPSLGATIHGLGPFFSIGQAACGRPMCAYQIPLGGCGVGCLSAHLWLTKRGTLVGAFGDITPWSLIRLLPIHKERVPHNPGTYYKSRGLIAGFCILSNPKIQLLACQNGHFVTCSHATHPEPQNLPWHPRM